MTNEPASTSGFPSWSFVFPSDVLNKHFTLALYGQDPVTDLWYYWDFATSIYKQFPSTANGQYTALLNILTPSTPPGTGNTTVTVTLPSGQQLQSGVVAMFIGTCTGIPVTNGVPASPTLSTNPGEMFSIFELTYATPVGGTAPILDIDISNIDQVSFTYTVVSTGTVPFPMATIGSPVAQASLFSQFAAAFPAGSPFNECLIVGQDAAGTQKCIVAPQDVIQSVTIPDALSYLAPAGTPGTSDLFANNSYFYLVTETSPNGESLPNSQAVFGGFLKTTQGTATASEIDLGWQTGGSPCSYTPANPLATGINIYRATGPGAIPPTTPAVPTQISDYGLITSQSISDWNNQPGPFYVDSALTAGAKTPPSSSYGFSALSTWFDAPLRDFFGYYLLNRFQLYQSNQTGGSNGTLWLGKVQWVWPKAGQPITSATYIDANGKAHPVNATWQWGDGTQAYLALQLVGNAYDPTNYTNANLAQTSGLTAGEYQGAVVNIYFPYFLGNTGLGSVNLPATLTDMAVSNFALSNAPAWLANASNDPSQMVFGCSGVFATPNDPDALVQAFPLLATNALTNIENVIVSALNRGIATGYGFALAPQQYTCLYAFNGLPTLTAQANAVPVGTYTYYLSGLLPNGAETALTWGVTVAVTAASAVQLLWDPLPSSLYQQVNIYRQTAAGQPVLVGTVANSSGSLATSFTDTNQPVTQPTNGAPYLFYPSWNDQAAAGFVPSNLYSAFMHQNATADPTNGISINGLTYGYPFDDQGGFSTNINYGTAFPTTVTFTISSLT